MPIFTIINHAGKIKIFPKKMGASECQTVLLQEMPPGVCSSGPPFQWINLSEDQLKEVVEEVQRVSKR